MEDGLECPALHEDSLVSAAQGPLTPRRRDARGGFLARPRLRPRSRAVAGAIGVDAARSGDDQGAREDPG